MYSWTILSIYNYIKIIKKHIVDKPCLSITLIVLAMTVISMLMLSLTLLIDIQYREHYLVISVVSLYPMIFFLLVLFLSIALNLNAHGQRYKMVSIDHLTSLYNRRYLDNIEWSYYHDMPLSVISLDIDHFKNINDTFGHAIGDKVLCNISNIIKRYLTDNVVAIRMGGDEIVMIISNVDIHTTVKLTQNIKEKVEDLELDNGNVKATISIGISHINNFEGTKSQFEYLLKESDIQLYKAKRKGRNQVSYTYV